MEANNHKDDKVVISTGLAAGFIVMSALFIMLAFFVAKSIYIQDIESEVNPIIESVQKVDTVYNKQINELRQEIEILKRENNTISISDTVYVKHIK